MAVSRIARAGMVAAIVALATAASAQANDFTSIYRDYRRNARIEPCRWSDRQLSRAARQTPADIQQYAPSFLDALDSARQARASGGCAAAGPSAARPPAPKAPAPASVSVPSPRGAALGAQELERGAAAPLPVWLLAGVGAFAALVALLAGLVRFYGWSAERWSRRVGAAISEAGGRTADFALEFWDWLRLGR